jgi:hypothetical protein
VFGHVRETIGRRQISSQTVWEERLARLGRALDDVPSSLMDVAAAVTSERIYVTALVARSGYWLGQWVSETYVLTGDDLTPIKGLLTGPDADSPSRARPQLAGALPLTGRATWAARLGAVGIVLDRQPEPLAEPSIVQVADGFVMTALRQISSDEGAPWASISLEISAVMVDEVLANPRTVARLIGPAAESVAPVASGWSWRRRG